MNDRQRDLFGFVGAAFAVMAGLFILQEIVRTAGDARFHARIADGGRHPDTLAARERDAQKLQSGKMPIEAAMQEVASKGRSAFPSIAPNASEDVSALSGWVHRRGFAPYVPPPPPAPPPAEAAPGVEGETAQEPAAVEGDAKPPAGAVVPAPVEASPAVPAAPVAKPAEEKKE